MVAFYVLSVDYRGMCCNSVQKVFNKQGLDGLILEVVILCLPFLGRVWGLTGTTEDALTADVVCVYGLTKARSGTTPVCLWGHSLGTG